MNEAMKVFIPPDSQVSSYQIEKILGIAKESHIWETEEDMAISSIDQFKIEHIKNFNNHLKFFDMLNVFFNPKNKTIPSEFEDEIKTLDFLMKLKCKKSIKAYKKYLKEKENTEQAEASHYDFNIDDNGMSPSEYKQELLNSEAKAVETNQKIAKQTFKMKVAFHNFCEAFSEEACFEELKDYVSKETKKYNELKKQVQVLAEDAICAIEDDEDVVESLEALLAFKGGAE